MTSEISRPIPYLAIHQAFHQLPEEKKNEIYSRVWELDGKPLGDPEYGAHHVFDKKERLYTLLPQNVQKQLFKSLFDRENQGSKGFFYRSVWKRDGSPSGDPQYGEHHILDDLKWLSDKLAYQTPLYINCVEPGEHVKTNSNPILSDSPREYPKHGIYRNGSTHPHLENPYAVPDATFGCIKLDSQKASNLPGRVQKAIEGKYLPEINILFFSANWSLRRLQVENANDRYLKKDYSKADIPQAQELPINLYFHGVVYPYMKLEDHERKQSFPLGIFNAQGEARWFGGWGGAPFEELQPTEIYAHKLSRDATYIARSPNNARLWVKNNASFYSVLINGDKAHVTLHVSRKTEELCKVDENPDLKLEDIPEQFPGPAFANLRDLLS